MVICAFWPFQNLGVCGQVCGARSVSSGMGVYRNQASSSGLASVLFGSLMQYLYAESSGVEYQGGHQTSADCIREVHVQSSVSFKRRT